MSTHFSANQYEQAFAAQRLQNWEVPKRFKERPSTLEGFTRIISNDSGHILEGIPRSSKSPWGEFVGTWDMQKPPLRTRTLKTKAMVEKLQDARTPSPTKMRTPSPEKPKSASPVIEQARTPSPTKMRTPTPQKERTPSPTKVRTPTPQCTSPTKIRTPTPTGRKNTSPVQQKATPVLEAES